MISWNETRHLLRSSLALGVACSMLACGFPTAPAYPSKADGFSGPRPVPRPGLPGDTAPPLKLQPGDVILAWSSGDSTEGEVTEARVTGKVCTDEIVPVINLVLGNREPFIAGGFLARSKPPRDEVPVETVTKQHHSHE